MPSGKPDKSPPSEVKKTRSKIKQFFDQESLDGIKIGSSTCAVYAFFDYDGEPIYVGQTVEQLRGRVGRHLTGRRSDAVGKFVLDPFEVMDISVWPMFFPTLPTKGEREEQKKVRSALTNRMEYAVYQQCLAGSQFHAVLNEKVIAPADAIELPPSYRGRIIPDELYEDRKHPDIRIARRAGTIASLARLISERQVDKGLRSTLKVQAQRLDSLAQRRYADFSDEPDPVETGEDDTDDDADETVDEAEGDE